MMFCSINKAYPLFTAQGDLTNKEDEKSNGLGWTITENSSDLSFSSDNFSIDTEKTNNNNHTPLRGTTSTFNIPSIEEIPKKKKKYRICGYDYKELLLIVLIGIVLIFILDMFVKIGKKTI